MPDVEGFLDRLRQLILSEAEQQRYELRRQWSLPLRQRIAAGVAIEGLRLSDFRKDGIVLLTCQRNDSRFREGDYLVLHRGDVSDENGKIRLRGVLEYDDETELAIRLSSGNVQNLKDQVSGWIADEELRDMSMFYLGALDQAAIAWLDGR